MKNYNNTISVWRIIFTYLVAIMHFDTIYKLKEPANFGDGWYIAVEFFFIVSGYLLYNQFDKLKVKYNNAFKYTLSRYRKIYPYFVISFFITFMLIGYCREYSSIKQYVKLFVESFWEFIGLQGMGLDRGWSYINPTAWYISVLFINGFILYNCLDKFKKLFVNLVAPIIIMVVYSYLYRNFHHLDVVTPTTGFYINCALMRGMADMCLGIYAACLNKVIKEKVSKIGFLKIISTLSFFGIIIISWRIKQTEIDFLFALVMTFSISVAFLPSNNKILGSRVIRYWSDITLAIYLIHESFRTYIFPLCAGIPQAFGDKLILMAIYLVVITIAAMILDWIVKNVVMVIYDKGKKWLLN